MDSKYPQALNLVGLEYGAKDEGMYSAGFRRLCVIVTRSSEAKENSI